MTAPDDVAPESFAGLYRFLEDGWRGSLLLSHHRHRRLVGRYRTDRYPRDYRVVAEVDPEVAHQVRITIADYNEMPEQLFVGYLFRPRANVIAGVTYAEGTTFGFCARETRSLVLASYRKGGVRPEDFAGAYSVREEDRQGILRLEHEVGAELRGTYRPLGGDEEWPVTARVDDRVPHQLTLRLEDGSTDGALFTGHLFTRPKNAVAGWVEGVGPPRGFYMVKLTDPGAPPSTAPAG